jgi:FAD/FMN-containing dehydrogenase
MISPSAIEKFKASLSGALLLPGQAGYEEARKVWNGSIDRRPALIARCAGVSDVMHCVNFARANEVLVAVRGGGHNIGGNAVCDDGLMIDLSRLKELRVDPAHRTARAEPGLT